MPVTDKSFSDIFRYQYLGLIKIGYQEYMSGFCLAFKRSKKRIFAGTIT